MRKVIDAKKEIDQNFKDLLHLDLIEEKIAGALPPLQNYNSFTNEKFLLEERVDALLVKNALLEIVVMSAIKVFCFILFNRLFYCLFNHSVSRFFRPYSFKIFLLEVLFLEDIQKLAFLLIRNFGCLFRVESGVKSLAVVVAPILLGSIILLSFLLLIPFQRYLHGKLSKYFLTNMFRIKGSLPLTYMLYAIKPLLIGSIQAICFENPTLQLGLLSAI